MVQPPGRGRFYASFVALTILLAIVVTSIVGMVKATSSPDLGGSPGGTPHGNSQAQIAAAIASNAALQLVAGPHALIVLSEKDLTTLLLSHTSNLSRFSEPEVRVRNGLLVVSVDADVGPFTVTPVIRLQVSYVHTENVAHIVVTPKAYEVGQLDIPAWLSRKFVPTNSLVINLDDLFHTNVALGVIAQSMECVSVRPNGVNIGFRRPGYPEDPSICTGGS